MVNVDAGNSPGRPENPRALRSTWRVTWLAVAGLVLFALLFVAVERLRDSSGHPDPGIQQQQSGPGERSERPQPDKQQPRQ